MKPYSDKVWIFCYGNELKFTYEHLQFQKFFLGSLALAVYGRRGEGWEGRGREGRGKGEGETEGRKAGELAPQTQKPNSAYGCILRK
jgi:hypothetical protein